MKAFIGLIVLAFAIYFGAKQGYIKGQWLGSVFGLGPSANQKAIEEAVKNTNSRLPRMLSSDISFDRVTANKEEVVFHYRFVNLDQVSVMQQYGANLGQLQSAIIQDVCSSKDIRDYVFAGGYAAQVLLRSSDVKTILNTYVRSERCRS